MKVSETLSKAADLLEEHGWIQFKERTADGRMCLRGAVATAAGVKSWRSPVADFDEEELWDYACPTPFEDGAAEFSEAEAAILEHNPALQKDWAAVGQLEDWNDAPGRTKTEVVQLLRATAELTKAPVDKLK